MVFCYACGNQLREGAAFCDKCGKPQGSQGPPPASYPQQQPALVPPPGYPGPRNQAPAAAPAPAPAPAAQKLTQEDGQLTPFGISVAYKVFDCFDDDQSGTLELDELNALSTFADGQAMNADAWGFVVDLVNIQLTPNGHIPKAEYPKLFRLQLHTDPQGARNAIQRLGLSIDASAFPPPPSPQELQQFQQICFDKARQQLQQAQQAQQASQNYTAAQRQQAQAQERSHQLQMNLIRNINSRTCRSCGATTGSGRCDRCGSW